MMDSNEDAAHSSCPILIVTDTASRIGSIAGSVSPLTQGNGSPIPAYSPSTTSCHSTLLGNGVLVEPQ